MNKMYTFIILLAVCSVTYASSECEDPSITVIGRSIYELSPDIIVIRALITSNAKTAAEAQRMNQEKSQDIISFLQNTGVSSDDLSTSSVTLGPKYEYTKRGRSVVVGFNACQSLTAKFRKFEIYVELVSGAVKLGLDRIWDVSFERSDIVEKTKEAKVSAIKAAREKAAYLSYAIGQTIGKAIMIKEIEERSSSNRANTYMIESIGIDQSKREKTNLPPGKVFIKAAVKVKFMLK